MKKELQMNSLVLAYLGDAIYELLIRTFLVEQGICKVNELQKEAVYYVSAKGQTYYLEKLIEKNILTAEEMEIVKRARNHKNSRHPKNTDMNTYKKATGFEALFGYHYMNQNWERIKELMISMKGEIKCIFTEEM